MTLDFTDFDSGEAIVFGVDVDPTTIQGVPGSGGAGAVSGLELSGSPVTVTFSDGTVLSGQLFGDGTAGGGQAVLSEISGLADAPGIEMLGVTTTPTVFPNNSSAGFVPTAGTQTVQVTGPVGAAVTLLAVEGALPNPAAFDLDPSESDEATAVTYLTGTVGAGGFVDFTVDLTSESSLYHYLAAIDDGSLGDVSPILVIGIGDVDTPIIDPIANVVVEEGDTIAVPISAIDPNGDPITLGIASTPDIEALGAVLTDNGDGTGSLDWVTETGDADTYNVDITAFDGTNTGTTSFTIVVNEPGTTQPAAALVQITPGGALGATTFGNSSITVTNDGGPTSPDITSVTFDLRGSLIPDATFSPTPRSIRSAPPATRAPSASPSAAKAAPDSSCPATPAPTPSPCLMRTPPEFPATAGTA